MYSRLPTTSREGVIRTSNELGVTFGLAPGRPRNSACRTITSGTARRKTQTKTRKKKAPADAAPTRFRRGQPGGGGGDGASSQPARSVAAIRSSRVAAALISVLLVTHVQVASRPSRGLRGGLRDGVGGEAVLGAARRRWR